MLSELHPPNNKKPPKQLRDEGRADSNRRRTTIGSLSFTRMLFREGQLKEIIRLLSLRCTKKDTRNILIRAYRYRKDHNSEVDSLGAFATRLIYNKLILKNNEHVRKMRRAIYSSNGSTPYRKPLQ